MKNEDVVIGMKVVPNDETVDYYSPSGEWNMREELESQPFYYVNENDVFSGWRLSIEKPKKVNEDTLFWDLLSSEFEPYKE